MSGTDTNAYQSKLSEALAARKEWLEKSELGKLKDALRAYQSAFSSLYTIYLKKGLINEDPYKQEAKIGELEVPDTGGFGEAERIEQLSIRLANFDNQLDFLVNFYQFAVEFLSLDRLKRILALVRYIDWVHLTPDSQSPNTRAVAEITNQSKTGVDPIALGVIGESLTTLSKSTSAVTLLLKELVDYNREFYKYEVRGAVTAGMKGQEATVPNIKKKFAAAMPGRPFYPDLIEEIIREDYSKEGPVLQEEVLRNLALKEAKPGTVKAEVSYKSTLVDGLQVLGSIAPVLGEIGLKLDENEAVFTNRKKNFWDKLHTIMQQIMNREPDEIIYDIEYMDPVKGIPVREKLNFHRFRGDMDRKIRVFNGLASHGPARTKLQAMKEEQLNSLLEKNIHESQAVHRTLTALDEYFKAGASREERDRIKGIKPELAAVKNAIVRANQLRHEYGAQKEEEEQMKRLGISPGT
ncbi:MAG: hypothetical protein LBP23_09600 [Treponema sp.]|jgi:hypothetical protein|nr:hypothetical protein [Treponema sp.]